MKTDLSAKKEWLINLGYYGGVLAIIYIAFEYGMPLFLPFLLGYMFSVLSHRITRNRSTVMLAVLYVLLGLLIFLVASSLIGIISNLISLIPDWYRTDIKPAIDELYAVLEHLNDNANIPGLANILDTALEVIKNGVSSLSSAVISALTSGVVKVPTLLFSTMIFIISSFYFTMDYDQVDQFVKSHGYLKEWAANKLFTLAKSYAIIIAMTFVELSIGLAILGVERPLFFGLLIALVDILPVLGTGTVLIPWSIISMVLGHWFSGIGLLVLYVIITIVRQYVEPRLVGGNLGLPPIISLIAMTVGLRLFGLTGMIGLPLLVSYYLYARRRREQQQSETEKQEEEAPVTE